MMERHLDQDLEQIRQRLLEMGGEVEDMVAKSVLALLQRDSEMARSIKSRDVGVDQQELALDDACLAVLARQQPTAVDLRLLVSTMKIVNNLERIGDSAVNISDSVQRLNEEPPLKPYVDLPRMADIAQEMVRESLDSFVRRDSDMAISVCERDNDIDRLYAQIFRELLTFMIEKPSSVGRALDILLICHNLERIADHATNIAEYVVYYLEGRDIRHPGAAPGSA